MRQYILKPTPKEDEFEQLAKFLGSVPMASAYWYRGVKTIDQIHEFSLGGTLLPIDELFDLKSFYKIIKKHKDKGSKVIIYGDYDADGAVAASILWRFLAQVLKMDASVYIPNRHEEGYGLNKQALLNLNDQKVNLVITVDCGVRDSKLIDEIMKETKMEVVVTDHHQPGDTFPSCVTVHPLYPGHESKNRYTSGGVVVWKCVRYLEEQFKLTHKFSDSVIDLAGISLVTDIMPLTGENRLIVKRAIQKLRVDPVLGIRSIIDVAQVTSADISTYHIGYVIGPRLNASGRIGDPYTSTRLLCTDKSEYARKYASDVHEINVRRQELTKSMLTEAESRKNILANKLIVAYGENWDDGIIGLVAGRLMNTYDMPTIAISVDKEKGIAKGSARSFGDFDITKFLESISAVFEKYGGHHNAAGFSLKTPDVDEFMSVATKALETNYKEYIPLVNKEVDGLLDTPDLTEDFFEQLSSLEPFGPENPAPLFAIQGKIGQFLSFGTQGNHVKIDLQTTKGQLKVLAFDSLNILSTVQQGDERVIIGKPKLDEYQGRKQVTFILEQMLTLPELRSL